MLRGAGPFRPRQGWGTAGGGAGWDLASVLDSEVTRSTAWALIGFLGWYPRHSDSLVLSARGSNDARWVVVRGGIWRRCWTVRSPEALRWASIGFLDGTGAGHSNSLLLDGPGRDEARQVVARGGIWRQLWIGR